MMILDVSRDDVMKNIISINKKLLLIILYLIFICEMQLKIAEIKSIRSKINIIDLVVLLKKVKYL